MKDVETYKINPRKPQNPQKTTKNVHQSKPTYMAVSKEQEKLEICCKSAKPLSKLQLASMDTSRIAI